MLVQKKWTSDNQILGAQARPKTAGRFAPIYPKVICVTSGKGGVGKTLTTIHLAASLAASGLRVMILDGDMGLANVDIMLGLQPRFNIFDVIEGNAQIQDIVIDGPGGIRVIPSGSGIRELTRLSYIQRLSLKHELAKLEEQVDVLLVDTGAGISDTVIHFVDIASDILVVTTPEPHAITDAYAAIKVIHEEYSTKTIYLAVNQVAGEPESLKVFDRIADVCRRFLSLNIHYAGSVPVDKQVQTAVAMRRVAQDQWQQTLSGQAWLQMSRTLVPAQSIHRNAIPAGQVLYQIVNNNNLHPKSM